MGIGVSLVEYAARTAVQYNASVGDLIGYNCPDCKNRGGYLIPDDDGFTHFRPCKCMKIRRSLKAAEKNGMSGLLNKTVKEYQVESETQNRLKQAATEYIQGDHTSWFVMLGQTGAGKTHLCAAVTNYLMKNGQDVYYLLWTSEIKAINRSMGEQGTENTAKIKQLERVPVLFIDDLFKGGASRADIALTFEIINSRAVNRQTTIISSELFPEQIAQIDSAIMGRIKEMAKQFLVVVQMDDSINYRLQKDWGLKK